jgi:hypothetical protein
MYARVIFDEYWGEATTRNIVQSEGCEKRNSLAEYRIGAASVYIWRHAASRP